MSTVLDHFLLLYYVANQSAAADFGDGEGDAQKLLMRDKTTTLALYHTTYSAE
jgi:hypothetical protein